MSLKAAPTTIRFALFTELRMAEIKQKCTSVKCEHPKHKDLDPSGLHCDVSGCANSIWRCPVHGLGIR